MILDCVFATRLSTVPNDISTIQALLFEQIVFKSYWCIFSLVFAKPGKLASSFDSNIY